MSLLYDDLLEQIAITRYDGYFMALCPFHEQRVGHPDNRPSFMVHDDEEPNSPYAYKCKSCGAHGSLEYLAKWLGKNNFNPGAPGAEREYPVLPKWRKWIDKYGSIENIAEAAHGFYCRNEDLRSFFVSRGIDRFYMLGKFGWLDWWNLFPVHDQAGKVTDIVVRGGEGKADTKYVLLKKPEGRTTPPVYVPDWDLFMQSDTVYVPYGIVDAWAFRALGLASLTGTTGKSLHPEQLYRYRKNWVLVPDAREEPEAWELKMQLGSCASVKELNYPYKTKDPDGIWRKFGAEALLRLLGA